MKKLIILFKNFVKLIYTFFLKKKIVFFCENEYTFEYLKTIIEKKSKIKKNQILIISKSNIFIKGGNFKSIFISSDFLLEIFFLTLRAKILYTTTPGLEDTFFKRSILCESIKYIYIQHSHIGLIKAYSKNAFKSFNAIQVINSYQYSDALFLRKKYSKKFKIFKSKYQFIFNKISTKISNKDKKDFLIAPTWSTGFYENELYLKIINLIKNENFSYVLRPHPMSFFKREIELKDLKKKNIIYDIASNIDLNDFKYLISDWSGIYFEFFLIKNKKSILFNTKMKILNNEFDDCINPIELDLRNELSITINTNNLEKFKNMLISLKKDQENILQIDNFFAKKKNEIFF